MKKWAIAIAVLTAVLYGGSIVLGLRFKSVFFRPPSPVRMMAWEPPSQNSIPDDTLGESIRRGSLIFDETPLYAAQYTKAHIGCSDCHAEGGI